MFTPLVRTLFFAAYAWLYAKNRSKIARVDEETSLLSQTEENPFGPNGLEITKF